MMKTRLKEPSAGYGSQRQEAVQYKCSDGGVFGSTELVILVRLGKAQEDLPGNDECGQVPVRCLLLQVWAWHKAKEKRSRREWSPETDIIRVAMETRSVVQPFTSHCTRLGQPLPCQASSLLLPRQRFLLLAGIHLYSSLSSAPKL